jgi:hypothetical protein
MKRVLTLALTATAPDWVDVVRPWLVLGCGLALVLARNPSPF